MEKIKSSEQKSRRTLRGSALAVACVVAGGPAIAAEAAPLAAFGRLPTLEDVAISPDGSKLAFVKTDGDSRKLLVIRLGAKTEVIGGALVSNVKLREVGWIDDDNIVATVSSTAPPPFGFTGATREWFQLVNFNLTKLKIHALSFDIDNVETFNVITNGWTVRDLREGERSAAGGVAAWRPCRGGHAGFRLVVAGARSARLRRAVTELPRLDSGFEIPAGGLRRMGPQDAIRPVRRRALPRPPRDH
jgi:hypothetical protein